MAVWLVFLSFLYGFCFCTQTIEDRVASLEAIVRQQNDNITALLNANDVLKQEVAVLHEKNVKDKVASLDDIVRQHNDNITSLLVAKDILKQEVAVLQENSVKYRVRRQSEAFGFTAYHDRDETLHQGQTLKFSKTLYNANSMYNPNTGVVTIPVDGTYIFSVAIEHWETRELSCNLLVNGENMVGVIITPNGWSTQSSNTAVLGLIKGNAVWVSCNEGHVYGNNGFHGTTFSGALLY